MFIKLIKVNGNNKKPIRSGEEITRFLSLIKLPLPGMAFSVPFCRSRPGTGGGRLSQCSTRRYPGDRITLKNLSEAVSRCSPSESGICRGDWESSLSLALGQTGPWAPGPEPGLSSEIPAVTGLPRLRSQTKLCGFKGDRARLVCPTLGIRFPSQAVVGSPLQRCFLVPPLLESLAKQTLILLKHWPLGKIIK